MALKAAPGYVLVQVGGKYENVSTPTRAYEGATSGIVKFIRGEDAEYLGIEAGTPTQDFRVYWEELVSGATIRNEDGPVAFVKVTDIRGFEHV